ncbi:MAG: DUF4386 domain-containing protein [Nakamurella sp.]
MTTTVHTTKTTTRKRLPMTFERKTSLAAGVLYLITFISIPTLALYQAARTPEYIVGAGPDTPVLLGGILEMIVALAAIGTAVALYPVLKRQNQSLAMGFVGIRVLEAATIFSGVVTLLSVVTLRQTSAGVGAMDTARGLIALHDWTFTLGQGTLPAVNDLLLGTLLYKSGLVPRALSLIGIIGAPVVLASVVAKYFGLYDELSAWSLFGAVPVAVFEFSVGVYLVVKGFRRCRITADLTAAGAPTAARTVTA